MMKKLLKTDVLPETVTSYDVLKTLAVLLMIVDHLGAYFFPEQDWFRAVGRLCVPMWFFLIGYARTRDIPFTMWFGALILLFANFMVGLPVLGANVLVTMIIVRIVLDYTAKFHLSSLYKMVGISIFLVILSFPTMFLTEYGSVGLMLALAGYFVRNSDHVKQMGWSEDFPLKYMIFSILIFIVQQQLDFGFSVNVFTFVAGGSILVGMVLMRFKPVELTKVSQSLPGFAVSFLQLFGRRTLEIYVLHLILFKSLALYLGYDLFEFMRFILIKEGVFY